MSILRVLIACEESGVTRRAFRAKGHDAWSCDLLPSRDNSPFHIQGNVLDILNDGWDILIAHPPCDDLSVSGAAWFKKKRADGRQQRGIDFFMKMANAPIKRICIENPVCIMSTVWRKPDQIIHPWQFGHPEQKTTCLWLKNLHPLEPTKSVYYIMERLPKHKRERNHFLFFTEKNVAKRKMMRSETYAGVSEAMAEQWGDYTTKKIQRPCPSPPTTCLK